MRKMISFFMWCAFIFSKDTLYIVLESGVARVIFNGIKEPLIYMLHNSIRMDVLNRCIHLLCNVEVIHLCITLNE